MARLFTSGFEINSLVSGMEFRTITGSPSLSSTIRRSGNYAMRCNPTAAAHYASVTFFATPVSTTQFARAYVLVASAPSAATLIMQFSNAGTLQAGIILNTDRTLTGVGQLKGTIGSPSSALALNTWYRVEMAAENSSAGFGSATFKLDGTTFAELVDDIPDIDAFDRLEIGVIEATTADIYFDDVAINNTAAGGTETSFPGEGRVVIALATSDVTANWNTIFPASPTTHYDKVNENPPNDATSYIETNTNGDLDEFHVQDSATIGIGPNDTIKLVEAHARWNDTTSGIASFKGGMGDGTNNEDSGNTDAASAATWVVNTDHNTADSVDFRTLKTTYDQLGVSTAVLTPAYFDTMRVRVSTGDADTYRVTAAWLQVEYVSRGLSWHPDIEIPLRDKKGVVAY